MAFNYKNIVVESGMVVREVDGIAGWTSNTEDLGAPMIWSKLNSKGNYGKIVEFNNIDVDGVTYSTIKTLRLFAFNSGTFMYTKWVINNPLLPGEEVELTFYASRGENLNANTNGNIDGSGTAKCAQILFATDPTKFDEFINRPNAVFRTDEMTHEQGDGILPASNGSNVGVVTSWQSKSGRSVSTWVTCSNTPGGEPGTLAYDDVPNETGSEFTKVYKIVIRNDTEQPAYLAMLPDRSIGDHFYMLYHDIQIKVTSSALKTCLGQIEDSTHHLVHSSPYFDGSNFLNMNNHSLVNIGTPSKIPSRAVSDYSDGTTSNILYRSQLVNKKFYDHWSVYQTPVYLPINATGHDSEDKMFASLSNLDYNFSGTANEGTPGNSAYNTWIYMPHYKGRFYSISLRTQNSYKKTLTATLYKFNSYPKDASGSITALGVITLNKSEGFLDTTTNTVTGYLPVTGASDGEFLAGDILMLSIRTPDDNTIALGGVIGTVTLLRGTT